MGQFSDRVVFITGVARGQGRSHAVRFAEEGAAIVGLDVCAQLDVAYAMSTEDDLRETERLVGAAGGRILTRVADVRDPEAVQAVVDAGLDAFGRLDVVCANAGIGVNALCPSWEMPVQAWADTIDVNLTGVWNTVRATVPALLRNEPSGSGRGRGSIVMTSSLLALKGMQNVSNYTAAKHGVTGLMRSLALELGEHRIRANCVVPTQTLTPMIDNPAGYRAFRPDLAEPTREDFAAVSLGTHVYPEPWVMPEDLTAAVLWLASDEARYVTGISLPVDCGGLLKSVAG